MDKLYKICQQYMEEKLDVDQFREAIADLFIEYKIGDSELEQFATAIIG